MDWVPVANSWFHLVSVQEWSITQKADFKWLVFALHVAVLGGKLDSYQLIKIREIRTMLNRNEACQ